MKEKDPTIVSIGTAVPEPPVTQARFLEHACQTLAENVHRQRVLKQVYRRTGIKTRCSVAAADHETQPFFPPRSHQAYPGPGTEERMSLYAREAPLLATKASLAALSGPGMDASLITHLITVTCSGFFAPGIDLALISRLPLPPGVNRFQLGFMGCHGAVNGLNLAQALARSQPGARILLCAVELCSLHFQYEWTADNVLANSLFADGAASAVVSSAPAAGSTGLAIAAAGSHVIPDSSDALTWRITDHGFVMRLSQSVPDLIAHHLPGWLTCWLGANGLGIDDIASWCVHPGGPRILAAVESCLNLPPRALVASRAILSELGNMSSPTVLFILDRLARIGRSGPCLVLAFGPGLVIEALLLYRR